ncbi:unnamed protein product, partial [Ectocarpus sp. 4 AP-2014]
GSKNYWEKRYTNKGTSGAGSYNRLATFKADVLNAFVKENNIKSVVEFGCGDGNQLSLATYPDYIGVDVSKTAVQLCKNLFKEDASKRFFEYNTDTYKNANIKADLSLSLDVIYHLIEDPVFEAHMTDLFSAATKYVIIYSSNYDKKQTYHERDRTFTDWVTKHCPTWSLLEVIKNPYPF